jgi:hypothetical protein
VAGAQSKPATLTGTWELETKDSPHGAMTMGLVLAEDGGKVSGKLLIPHAGEIPLAGVFAGGKLVMSTAGDDHALKLGATLKDDGTLTGYVSSEMGDMTWTGKRAAGR